MRQDAMKDRCIVNSIQEICNKCPDRLVQEVIVRRHGLEILLDPLALTRKGEGGLSEVKECLFPRAAVLKIEQVKATSIDGLGKIMPNLIEIDAQRNDIKSINAKTLPRRVTTLKLDGNPIEKVENAQYFSLLQELSMANAPGTLDVSWIKDMESLRKLNLSGKNVTPSIYRTRAGTIEKTGKKLGPGDISELREYLRQYPVEMQMAAEQSSEYDE